jgi:hypothetical protein
MVAVIGGYEITVIGLGFAGLAAGISARAVGRTDTLAAAEVRRPLRTKGAGKAVWAMILLAVIALSLLRVIDVLGLRPQSSSSPVLDSLLKILEYPKSSVLFVFTDNAFDWTFILALPAATWALVTAGAGFDRGGRGVSSFDVVVSSRKKLGRFLGPWIALTVVCICAIPTCFVAGLVLYHFRLTRFDWP